MTFLHDDFLLRSSSARFLYHKYAEPQPIIDYHNHLPVKEIAENRCFGDLYEAWLGGDHYKWRAMRANGISEEFCTGNAPNREKFLAWARTVPQTLCNPLFHWTHLELKRYFDIDKRLDQTTASAIWETVNAKLASSELSPQGILGKFRVAALCTTDDPTDTLEYHQALAESSLATKVYPAFRPDKALNVHQPETWNAWVNALAQTSNVEIGNLSEFLEALDRRHAFFHKMGGRLSDHGLNHCYADFPTDAEAASIFATTRSGHAASPDNHALFAGYLMLEFGRMDAKRGWTKQLHLGALRNVSNRGFRLLGPDTGFDSIGDWQQAQALSAYLDRLDQEGSLPKIILYNNNPTDNYVLATMAGNFQDGVIPGKIQFGSGWWFLDTKEGIEWQLSTLSQVGLLSRFIGMLTDSRSFLSFPRHEYFRRVLCDFLGEKMERGEIPDDETLVGPMVANICYGNAREYLRLEIQQTEEVHQP